METFFRFKGDVSLSWKWLRMWQISPAYAGTSSETGGLWMHCAGISSFHKRFIFVAKYLLLDVLMHVALCEQSFQVTPCRLMWVICFLCSYTSAKTTRKPYNYNWRSWHQRDPNFFFFGCPTGGTVISVSWILKHGDLCVSPLPDSGSWNFAVTGNEIWGSAGESLSSSIPPSYFEETGL